MRTYYVYIMASRSGVLYVGVTNDLSRRVDEHKSMQVSGFTKQYQVVRLVYYEEHQYVLDAIGREKEIKGWRREKKLRLIESRNPNWADLAERYRQGAGGTSNRPRGARALK